ncbi:MAG: ribulose 1,5-bisphosphate carboxylase, partial [Gammaproteobacteria bacterium]|nr:ribulose 1,5-bisphosphate carboxylase [Gammaproteobacteria bacterium]
MQRLIAHYDIAVGAADIEARAEALAVEQSIEMPLAAVRSAAVREHIVARVENIAPLGEGRHRVVLGIALETVGHDVGQLMNMLFGNCSLQEDVTLVDAEFPPALLARWPGPRHGLAGLRARVG